MPPSLRVPLNREDVIAHSIFVLETFKEISGTIGSVPFLGAVIGSALSLIKTIDAVKTDKERRVRLVRRVSKLLQDIQEAVAANPDVSDGNLLANLAVLQSTLTSIQVDLEALIGKSALSRWVHRGALAAKLDEHIGTVDEASRSFIRALLMSLSRKGDDHTRSLGALVRDVGEQAQYDKNQLRIIRGCDIALRRVRGKWQRSNVSGEEWEGEWQGRQVTVHAVRAEHSEEDLSSMLDGTPVCRHPYVLQLLGRSHPSETQRFFVMERDSIPAFQFLKSSDASSRLRCYLQMYIDYEDLVEHLRALQFPIAAPGEMHTHDAKCLSSLAIRQDGTLVLPAEDLAHANLRCLDCCLRHICEPSGQLMWSHETQYIPIGRHARTLLSALSHEPNDATFNADICHLRDSDSGPLPEIWCSLYLASPRRVKLGDYGYVHPDSKHFVCLGNMFDYLQRQAIFTWTESHISSDPLDIGNGYCSWSERRLSHRYTLKSGAFVHTELQKLVADELHGRFWWFHAFEVTMRHDVALQELVLVRATIQHSLVDASESLDIRTTPENCSQHIYFHELPCTEDGVTLSPFGYWSLDPVPIPGPWPDLLILGLQLHSWTDVVYTRLNNFQAELVTCFGQNLKDTCSDAAASGKECFRSSPTTTA